jgi:hypothetical protein
MQANPAGSSTQALGLLALTGLQSLAEKLSLKAPLGLLKPFHALLDQHLGHVAHRAGLDISELCQPLAELFGQYHLNTR